MAKARKKAVAAKKAATKREQRVKGLYDNREGKFFPYPLPLVPLEIHDEDYFNVEVSLRRAGTLPRYTAPLVVEFSAEFLLSDEEWGHDLSAFLSRTARQLGVNPVDLPARAPRPDWDSPEERALFKVKQALRGYLFEVILRWAQMEEITVPAEQAPPQEVAYPNDRLPQPYGE